MNNAARTRGFEAGTRWRTFGTLGNFVGVLLVRSFERTERLYRAMTSRGYEGELITLSAFHTKLLDFVKGAAVVLFCAMIILGDRFL